MTANKSNGSSRQDFPVATSMSEWMPEFHSLTLVATIGIGLELAEWAGRFSALAAATR
jgi:hypothetical protein